MYTVCVCQYRVHLYTCTLYTCIYNIVCVCVQGLYSRTLVAMLVSLHKVCCYMYVPVCVLCLLVKVCTVWMFVISLYLLMVVCTVCVCQ